MRELEETTIPGFDIGGSSGYSTEFPSRLASSTGLTPEAAGRSDIDFAVTFDESLSSIERTRARLGLIEQLSTELGTNDVDVVPLSDAPSKLLKELLTDGVLIYTGR